MAFPSTPLPIKVALALGASLTADPAIWTWTDVTAYVRERDRISYSVGKRDEASKVDPATCALRFDNRDGRFTPRNPAGAYYGQIRKNTPIRVQIKTASDTFGRTVSNDWSSADTGQTWTRGGGSASDYSVSGGVGRISLGTINVSRRLTLPDTFGDINQLVRFTIGAVGVGDDIETTLMSRYQDASNYMQGSIFWDGDSTFAECRLVRRQAGVATTLTTVTLPFTQLGAGLAAWMRFDAKGSTYRLKVWTGALEDEPAEWTTSATDTTWTAGKVGIRANLQAAYTGSLPLLVTADNYESHVDRFSGYVAAWPARWDKSANDSTVPVEAYGILNRLNQSKTTGLSPLRRTLSRRNPLTYLPLEDGSDTTQPSNVGVRGVSFGSATAVDFDSTDSPPGASSCAKLTDPLSKISTSVGASGPSHYSFLFYFKLGSLPTPGAYYPFMKFLMPGGTGARWQLEVGDGSFNWVVYDKNNSIIDNQECTWGPNVSPLKWLAFCLQVNQNGLTVEWGWDHHQVGQDVHWTIGGFKGHSFSGTVGRLAQIETVPNALWVDTQFSHIVATTLPIPLNSQPFMASSNGYQGEAAGFRISRLCTEDGVPLVTQTESADGVTALGRQTASVFSDLLTEAETADQGILYEAGFGLGYKPREYRYNPPVYLALDFNQRHIAEPPEPTDDDQQLRNRWTVSRPNGASAVAEDDQSVADFGRYDSSVSVNHFNDLALSDHAWWRVHLGTVEEMRWPRITLDLARNPSLIPAWLLCGIGSRITIANPPGQMLGESVDLIIEGYSETISQYEWTVELNCSPVKPWIVATVDGSQRVDSESSTLTSSLTSSQTSISVSTSDPADLWTTNAADMPFDVLIGGEKMQVTNVTGTSSPQTFTVVRSQNGVAKAQSAGAKVSLFNPAIVAL